MIKPTSMLRKLLDKEKVVVLPGCYDALTAKIIEKVGFNAAYLSGFAMSATCLGKPDYGILTINDIATIAKNVTTAVKIPVIADGEAGFGGPLNVARTVKEYEKAGLAGLHIEDQTTPKKGGALAGRTLVSATEMVGKIRAALDSREDKDFLIIARTDSRDISFDESVRRANIYGEAGADMIMIGSPPRTLEELEEYPQRIDTPLVVLVNEYRETGRLSVEEYSKMGWKMVWFILSELFVVSKALLDLWIEVWRSGTSNPLIDRMMSMKDFTELIGMKEHRDFEMKYLSQEELEKRYKQKQWGY